MCGKTLGTQTEQAGSTERVRVQQQVCGKVIQILCQPGSDFLARVAFRKENNHIWIYTYIYIHIYTLYVYYLLSTIICLEKTDMRWFQDYRYEVPSSEPRIVCIFVVMTLLRLISFVYIMTEVVILTQGMLVFGL